MSPTKRALLIASPFNGLLGPQNDVDVMSDALRGLGFEISLCRGESATRVGILQAWQNIIDQSSHDDAVVIYYSGHGGIVEDTSKPEDATEHNVPAHQKPWRYQFLVPMDFRADPGPGEQGDSDANYCFNGILDQELTHLTRATTDRTPNVTTILDCCHSGRMIRDPSRRDAVPRYLPNVQHFALSRHIDRLRSEGKLPADKSQCAEDNSHAVRVAAAAAVETAWEYSNSGRWGGAMTNALAETLRQVSKGGSEGLVSWRTALERVREVVKIDFPLQTPQVQGPERRLLFSLRQEAATTAFVVHVDADGEGILEAGKVSGVREGNVYTLMPLGAERPPNETRSDTATVTHLNGFQARVELCLASETAQIPAQGVRALLKQEALYKWPVACHQCGDELLNAVDESKYLCREQSEQGTSHLAKFYMDGQNLILANGQGLHLKSRCISDSDPNLRVTASLDLVNQAEQLARSQHLLALKCADNSREKLKHKLSVIFGTAKNSKHDRIIMQDGSGSIVAGEKVYMSLKNQGTQQNQRIYVSVFNVNIAGQISLISKGHSSGIELPPGRGFVLGAGRSGWGLPGLYISWPSGIPQTQAITESLVLVLTDTPVDLSHLANATAIATNRKGADGASSLMRLASSIATGGTRDMAASDHREHVRYDTLHIRYTLFPFEGDNMPVSTTSDAGDGGPELRAQDVPLVDEMVQQNQDLLTCPSPERAARVC